MSEKERIELIMRCYNLTSTQFADKTGIQRASVSHILSGRNKPSLEVMLKIYDSFPGLDMKWLMTGDGVAPSAVTQPALFDSGAEQVVAPRQDTLSFVSQPDTQIVEKEKPVQPRKPQAERAPRHSAVQATKQPELQQVRRIKEIRIFYTDGTYETMFPEK